MGIYTNDDDANKKHKLSISIKDNFTRINEKFTDCPDIITRHVYLKDKREAYFIYVEGMINTDLVERDFITPIVSSDFQHLFVDAAIQNLPTSKITYRYDIDSIVTDILTGCTAFIIDGMNFAVCTALRKFDKRSVTEPEVEKNVRGSHEGFVEPINTNFALLRRRVKNNKLKFKTVKLGTMTNQSVAVAYIDGLCDKELLDILYNKVKGINIDGLLAAGYVEQSITDFRNSPFPQYQTTERPDKAAAALLEGKFVILVEGTPVVLITPVDFFAFFQAMDDYSTNWMFGNSVRALRFFAMMIAIVLPGFYVAITTFHYYMVPLNLLVPLAESRARVPFPPIVEVLIMEITIEMLREAAIRLPTYIGSSIGVVGGIIIGQAAVQAGIVSDLLIIVVAITAVASFVAPNYDMGYAIRLLRFIEIVLSAIFGIIGIVIFSAIILAHLVVLESMGQPYFQPLIPFKFSGLRDSIVRSPFHFLKKRPDIAKPKDKIRGEGNEGE
ncbi:MAG: spore germination protein [Bacillota bacterium]|nr:spore germination protein [Bacillota bacterium]